LEGLKSLEAEVVRGLFMAERKQSLNLNDECRHMSEEKADSSAEAVRKWKTKALFKDEARWNKKLAVEGLTVEEFSALLVDNHKKIKEFPRWFRIFKECMSQTDDIADDEVPTSMSIAVRPFLQWAQNKLNQALNACSDSMINKEKVLHSMIESLGKYLVELSSRALVLELNVARVLNELEGDSEEDRYASFIRQFCKKQHVLQFYLEYIVLARILSLRTDYFVHNMTELIERYKADWPLLKETFHLDDCTLVKVETGLGDSHNKGKSVVNLQFESGQTLVYKPKRMDINEQVFDLYKWFNERGFRPKLTTYPFINRGEYGWEAFIKQQACQSQREIRDYYRRYGGLIAIMYLFNGTDMHYENIIASGENPFIIDLETIFHNSDYLSPHIENAVAKANREVFQSVVRTGLLPTLGFQNEDGVGVEISGLGGDKQTLPNPVLQLENTNKDTMRFVLKSAKTSPQKNRPSLNGKHVHPVDYIDDIVDGFSSICDIVQRHKEELLQRLTSLRDVEVRAIIRPTEYYARFVKESCHPDYLRHAYDFERMIDRIYFSPLPVEVCKLEKDELVQHDIPYFTTRPGSRDLINRDGRVIQDFYLKPAIELVEERIKRLSKEEIDTQLNYIKLSIIATDVDRIKVRDPEPLSPHTAPKINREQLLHHAEKIGEEIVDAAVWAGSGKDLQAAWIDLNLNIKGQWQLSSLGVDLYNGMGGIALFLGYLGHITGEDRFVTASKAALKSCLEQPVYGNVVSAFYGGYSKLYPLWKLADIHDARSAYQEMTNQLLLSLKDAAEKDQFYDYLTGTSGLIVLLLNMFDERKDERLLDVASRLGDHLVKRAHKSGPYWKWSSALVEKDTFLVGLGHGASGMTLALFRLYHATGKDVYREAFEKSFAYERSMYDEQQQNWIDPRKRDRLDSCADDTWCQGSIGIGISRLAMLRLKEDARVRKDLHRAIDISLQTEDQDDSLCHGTSGRVDFLLQAGEFMDDRQLVDMANNLVKNMVGRRNCRYINGLGNHLKIPGMWLGLSGIGYQLLRMLHPKHVPSVLLLN
jgi:type 2 lantibiotic biosynthesis protein LanM